jgi:phospholipid/cholesterol/gamma-HCH transport system substrate-binding protein
VKSFTERDPRLIGVVAIVVALSIVLGVLVLNRSVFLPSYTVHARFPDAAGIGKGAPVSVAGVRVGTVSAVHLDGNAVLADLAIDHGVVLPHETTAAITVQTILGVLDVTLQPQTGWNHPLQAGATITKTTVPVEFQDLQQTTGNLLEQSDVQAFNQMLTSLEAITQGKQQQVATIIDGLNRFTGVVDQRRGQLGGLIDAANTLASTVAQHDQQLGGLVDNLASVVQALADHSSQLGALIVNTEQMAAQTSTLVGQNQPQIQGLISHLTSVLGVIQQHQLDLAQGVSYLSSAVKGFSSIGYSGPNNTPQSWGNIYANLIGVSGAYGALGSCAAVDTALDQVLGSDPKPCDQRTGPPPTDTSATPSGGPGTSSSSSSQPAPSGGGSSSAPTPAGGAPSSPPDPLRQLLVPLLGG